MSFSRLPQTEFYLKLHAAEANIAEYTVRFRFNRSRLVVAFESSFEKEQYLFLSPGLFLKYFQRQKSLKKQNIMRVLMMRFLRKLLLSLRLKSINVCAKGTPIKLEMLLKMIMKSAKIKYPADMYINRGRSSIITILSKKVYL